MMDRRSFVAHCLGLMAGSVIAPRLLAQQQNLADAAFDPRIWIGDLAILNARVITLEQSQPEAEAVLVRGGRILAVGSNREIRERATGFDVLDAGGRALVPGFVDTHMHIEWTSAARKLMVNFWDEPPGSIAEVLSTLLARADETPAGSWVVAEGRIAQSVSEQRLPTIEELDSVSERHPIVVFNGVHTHIANSLAARLMGYYEVTDEAGARWWSNNQPYTGGTIARGDKGYPGIAHDVVMRLPRDLWSVEELMGAIRDTATEMWVAGGITTASPVTLVSTNEYTADQLLHASGELPLRLRAYYMAPFSVSVESVLDTGVARGFGNDMFRTGGFKLIYDGGRDEDGRQVHHYTQDEFLDLITLIHARGLQTITHCVSEEGAAQVTWAVEQLAKRFPDAADMHHRIEHWRPEMELGIRQRDVGMYFTMIAPKSRVDKEDPWNGPWSGAGAAYRSYIENGIHPILVTDKCSGSPELAHPMYSLAGACNSYEDGGITSAEETVSFDDALKMWTIWAAESTNQAHDRGSITTGKLGDFALLSGDPRKLKKEDLLDLKVDATILGGNVVWER